MPAPRKAGPSDGSCRITVRVADGLVVVAVTGDIDRPGAVRLRAELLDLISVCVGTLNVDLTGCTHLSEEGAQVLRYARRRSEHGQNRCRVKVDAERPDIRRALDATNNSRVRRRTTRQRPTTAAHLARDPGARSIVAQEVSDDSGRSVVDSGYAESGR